MYISKVEIYNFRSHKNTVVELSESNVLIGQNNSGKTAFLEAINYALSLSKNAHSEDDFFAIQDDFNPKVSDPIKIILELEETADERFSDNVQYKFENKIQYNEEIYPDDPIAYIKFCYEFRFDDDKGRYVDERYFLDKNSQKIYKSSFVARDHLSFIPCIFLTTLRDINKEIKNKSSNQGIYPDFRAKEGSWALEEERRNCYVSITRAKEKLYISYTKFKQTNYGLRAHNPSQFIEEMKIISNSSVDNTCHPSKK